MGLASLLPTEHTPQNHATTLSKTGNKLNNCQKRNHCTRLQCQRKQRKVSKLYQHNTIFALDAHNSTAKKHCNNWSTFFP
jgi:hypothetical protein